MINGAHVIIYSRDADADVAFLRDVLGFPHLDVGGGRLHVKLPPGEVAVHAGGPTAPVHELYLMCDDVAATVAELTARGVEVAPVTDQGWGRLTSIRLPGGGDLGLYEPRHAKAYELPPAR